MNLILERSKFVTYYTYIDTIFEKIPGFRNYNYFISDLEYNHCEDPRLHKDDFFITGLELYEIVQKEKIQFLWGVLSAFKSVAKLTPPFPYADGNPAFWQGSPQSQADGAEFEIVCWDSCRTLFIGVSEEIQQSLKILYPDIKNLDEENRKRKKPNTTSHNFD
ncbi:hypothetical protein LEP1GSC168_3058 [Leptospira santarosai str. HAI134]|uniref:hypothetical protein n=1 Tax=Leptospira santarosai TaxID=28183 RepID=UPI0002BFD5A6|nr:hypothetical protein [Leptospira santarosai]EMO24527.1 hypothetical protein LEP1GSC168_3058 [Leptospira santarosai str. HAI134]